jgi:hypothetical protein
MEMRPQEDASCTATQKLSNVFWNLKVYYRVHKSFSLVPIPSQISPVHSASLRSILILSTHLLLGLPSNLYPYGFPTNIL